MEKLKPTWFLEQPLDIEHKNYVLLDYLKKKSENLEGDKVSVSLKEVSGIMKVLYSFKESGKIPEYVLEDLDTDEREDIEKILSDSGKDSKNSEDIKEIVDSSLSILYDFSEIFMEILREEQEKIKIFKIGSRYSQIQTTKESGVLLIRNMITDRIIPYYWRETKMTMEDQEKDVVVLKKINLRTKSFSLSYEYIYHEVLDSIGTDKNFTPSFYVIEIYENFSEKSEIFKMAKERFIETLSKIK
jgi:hypothetical protein